VAAEAIESRVPIMGSVGHLVVAGAEPGLVTWARSRLIELESLWSRFREDSDLCRLNRSPGCWVELSPLTTALVRQAIHAWRATDGRFDPTVLAAVEAAGYTGSFETLPAHSSGPASASVPGCDGIEIRAGQVRLPPGVRLDLGGIGKGYAADLLAAELMAEGASGASVNLGGDVRVTGSPPAGDAWVVAIADETWPELDLAWLGLAEGAVATSTRLRRRWQRNGREAHHLIDPRTGTSSTGTVASVSVVAAQAHWAEVLAKAALIAGLAAGATLLTKHGVAGLMVTEDGAEHPAGTWERFVTWTPDCGGTSPARAE
jgi:thiamine biosynthesis lipoprotein